MKILVTGGAGFIGSHAVDVFIKSGHQVVVVDDLSTGSELNLNPAAKLYRVDIRDARLEEVFEAERPDYVSHHAAQISVRISVQKPLEDAQINVLGSLNVIEHCKKYNVKKLIYISTGGAVYGEPVYLPCDENHPVNPICQYGATKHAPEHYLFMYKQLYGLNYTVLRYPNVYGPRQDPMGEAGVIAIFTGQMLRGEQAVVNGSGEQERDYVFVEDVARANLLALAKGDGEIFNLGCGIGTTVNELFQRLKEITNYQLDAVHGPPKAGETFRIYLDASKAAQELGWRPMVDLDEGLRRTVQFFRERLAQ
ncbi:MAG: NAD-dependent epimerase/dehydratase family protein [Chloroflexi bacterium]|nr:NAD-dependent epimerase/dehydratase family protein [Chloroflexota bacterium]MDA8187184.1 NAD-dependent epimerase/dehydratase family protein [Dehalococcoidales bacterium]